MIRGSHDARCRRSAAAASTLGRAARAHPAGERRRRAGAGARAPSTTAPTRIVHRTRRRRDAAVRAPGSCASAAGDAVRLTGSRRRSTCFDADDRRARRRPASADRCAASTMKRSTRAGLGCHAPRHPGRTADQEEEDMRRCRNAVAACARPALRARRRPTELTVLLPDRRRRADHQGDRRLRRASSRRRNPDIKVKPIYAGNYDDTRVKALAALKAGQPAQLSRAVLDRPVRADRRRTRSCRSTTWPPRPRTRRGSSLVLPGADDERPTARARPGASRSSARPSCMYWNKEAFKEAGLDPNKPPATWTRDGRRWPRS
ncbi:MAG: hypothetical protein MZV65_33155 [Chromatiales bacterium]|nr:hypothetical protein [Chromatiales bacterium]